MRRWDAVVVGGGGAGLAAGLTLARAARRVLLVDAGSQRNLTAPHSHGILGLDGLSADELVAIGRADFERFGGTFRNGNIASGRPDGDDGFVLTTDFGEELVTRQVIVATGVRDELPDVPGVAERWGRGVVICPYCDGWENRGRRIGILATGRKSVFQAQLLRQWSPQVTFFVADAVELTREERIGFDARGIQVERGRVLGIDAAEAGESLLVRTAHAEVEVDVVFTAPRPHPADTLLRELGAATSGGGPSADLVKVDKRGATTVQGLWAVGNVVNPSLKLQTAMGAGMDAATHVNELLVVADVAEAVGAWSSD